MTTPSPDKLDIPEAAVEALPCPFCGTLPDVMEWMSDHSDAKVYCSNGDCNASGPDANSENKTWNDASTHEHLAAISRSEAIAAWNRRLPHMPDRGYAEVGPTYRHKKRGSEYVLVGYGIWVDVNDGREAEPGVRIIERMPGLWVVVNDWVSAEGEWGCLQAEGRIQIGNVIAIYRSVDDGSLWVRPREEFEDGRFEALTAPPATVSRGYAEGIEAAAKVAEPFKAGDVVKCSGIVTRPTTDKQGTYVQFSGNGKHFENYIPLDCIAVATPSPIEDVAEPSEVEVEFDNNRSVYEWMGRHDITLSAAAFQDLRQTLAARRVRPSPVDEEPSEGVLQARDEGADFVLSALARALKLENWEQKDGSETWDGDVRATLWGILYGGGVFDPETGERVHLLEDAGSLEDAAKAAFRQAQSEYRAEYDHFPLTNIWDTASEPVRAMWRKIAAAALGTRSLCALNLDEAAIAAAIAPYFTEGYSANDAAASVVRTLQSRPVDEDARDGVPQFTFGHCENRKAPGGCQLHNLHCGYPDCDRRPAIQSQRKG